MANGIDGIGQVFIGLRSAAQLALLGALSLSSAPAYAIDLANLSALQQGRFSHRVPLELPPAPRSLVPDIALVADHAAVDGPVGPNWNLTGFSRIERRGANGGAPAFDSTDLYYSDGQRLYWTVGPSQPGYRQELDDNRIFYRQAGDGQNHWTAQRDGWTWTFGEFEAGATLIGQCATESPGETYPCDDHPGESLTESESTVWLLSRIEDPAGNTVDFQYTGEAGFTSGPPDDWMVGARAAHQPSRVVYGNGKFELDFTWEARTDTSFAMRGGTPWVLASRLASMDLGSWNGTAFEPIGRYALHWLDDDVGLGVACADEELPTAAEAYGSFLHRIDRVGSDGITTKELRCVEVDTSPTTFNTSSTVMTSSGGADPVAWVPYPQDFDGDANVEVNSIKFENGGSSFSIASCGVPVLCDLDDALIEGAYFAVLDLDGDAISDVYALADDGVDYSIDSGDIVYHRLYDEDGVTVHETDTYTGTLPGAYLMPDANFVDIDGDGLADMVTDTGWFVNIGEAPWFYDADLAYPVDWYTDVIADWTATLTLLQTSATYEETTRWGDFNGDGIADVAHFVEAADLVGDADPAPTNESYSRLWSGDGFGHFVTTAYCEADLACAGTYFHDASPGDRTSWATADLDGDHRTELLTDSLSAVASDGGIEDGWCEGLTVMPVDVLNDEWICSDDDYYDTTQQVVLVDYDGDGFQDVYQIEADVSARSRTDTVWLNDRVRPRGRIQRIHGAWGGVIELGYAWSHAVGNNDELPLPVEVIRTVSDQDGTTTFTFSGGTFNDRRFQGFTDVRAVRESGATTYLKYAVSPGFAGSMVYQTEHRSDGTIARFSYNQYLKDGIHLWSFDDEPPYFNPAIRHCEIDAGPGYPVAGGVAQSFTVEQLAATCTGYFSSSLFSPQLFGIGYGWERAPGEGANGTAQGLTEVVWHPNGVANGTFADLTTPASGLWNPNVLANLLPYALIEGDVPAEIDVPSQPTLPPPTAGTNPTEFVAQLITYSYDTDQRIYRVSDKRNPITNADDLTSSTYYLGWNTLLVGKQEDHVTTVDALGNWRTVQYGTYSGFGLPGSLTESATNGTGSLSRTTTYTYDRGVVAQIQRPDGSLETFDINDCGYFDEHADGEGRVDKREFDAACNQTRREWEGSREVVERDVFGRIANRTLTPMVGGTSPDVVEEWIYDDVLDAPDDRADWSEPRSAVRYTNNTSTTADDVVEMTHLDPWGRPYLTVRCQDGGGDSGATGSVVLQAMSCDPDEDERRTWRAWAVDGTPRAESRGFAEGDVDVAATFTYADSLGLAQQVLRPGPYETPGTHVLTSISRTPGDVTIKDPGLKNCVRSATATTWNESCEGYPRSNRTLNAWGLVTAERNGAGVGYDWTYDAFGRAVQKKLSMDIGVLGGFGRPKWNWLYDSVDRPLVERDALGNEIVWTYDAAGRMLTTKRQPGSLGGPVATLVKLEYFDYAGTATSRFVKSTDVNSLVTYTSLDGLDRAWRVQYPDLSAEGRSWNARGELDMLVDVDGVTDVRTYNAPGNVVEETVGGLLTSTTEWSSAGDPIRIVDPYGVESEFTYTWDGRPSAVTRAHGGGSATWTLQDWTYLPDGSVDTEFRDGVDHQYRYDVLGRRVEACVGGDCGDWLMRYTWGYDGADRVVTTSRESSDVTDGPVSTSIQYNAMDWPTQTQDPLGGVEMWTYDVLGHVRRHSDPDALISSWNYDGWGRVTFEDLPHQNPRTWTYAFATPGGELHTRTEPDGGVWETWYDYAGRPHRERWADGTGVRNHYAGDQLRGKDYLDAGGVPIASEAYAYDAAGRPSWSWGPVDAPYDPVAVPGSGDWSFAYEYTDDIPGDGEYERTRVAPDGEKTTWVMSDGLVGSEIISDGGGAPRLTTTYGYGADYPRLQTKELTDAAGSDAQVTDYLWDRGLRLYGTTDQVGTGDIQERTFSTFDDWGVPRDADHVVGGTVQSVYARNTDALGRITSVTATHEGSTLGTVDYGYTAAGRVVSVNTSWAGGFRYIRGSTSGVIDQVKKFGSAITYAAITSRDPLGRPAVALLDGGAASITQTWDQMGRMATWEGDNGTDFDSRAWFYDPRGRPELVQHTDTSGYWEEIRGYEEPGWLIGEKRVQGATVVSDTEYVYDAGGNRTETWEFGAPVRILTYDGSFLDTVDGSGVIWERDGIVTDYAGTLIGRNPDGSESGVDVPMGVSYSIARDPWGRPVLTDDGGAAREQVWGNPGAALPLAGIDEDGDNALYIAAEGMLLGVAVNGTFDFAGTDPMGHLAFVGSEWLDTPLSFGQGVSAPTTSSVRNVFAGLELLPGTTYHLARHRLYDSETGRFASADPVGLAGGPNRFAYASNDPTRYADPEGYTSTECGIQPLGDLGFEGKQSPKYIEGPAGGPASPFSGGAPVTYYGLANLSVLDSRAHWAQGHHTYTFGNSTLDGKSEMSGPVATALANLEAAVEFWADSNITVLDFGPPATIGNQAGVDPGSGGVMRLADNTYDPSGLSTATWSTGPLPGMGSIIQTATDASPPTSTSASKPTRKASSPLPSPAGPSAPTPQVAPEARDQAPPTTQSETSKALENIQGVGIVEHVRMAPRSAMDRVSVAGDAVGGYFSENWTGFWADNDAGWRMLSNDFGGSMDVLGNGLLDMYTALPMTQARMGNVHRAGETLLEQGKDLGGAFVNTAGYGYHSMNNAQDLFSGDQRLARGGIERQMDLNADALTVIGTVATVAEFAGGFSGAAGLPCVGGSFPAGTLVLTSRGLVPIEEVRPGDLVWSEDPDTREAAFRRVLRVITHEVPTLVAVRWEDGGYGRHEVLATPEHPFYVDGEGWIAAADLHTGDLVPTADGGWLTVAGVDWVQETSTVYNLVVEDSHTFFVGEEGAWVHNTTGSPCDILTKGAPRGVEVGRFKLTDTVAKHADDLVTRGARRGEAARPYLNSPNTIEEIMKGGTPVPDPGGVPGALRWDVAGSFRGSEGAWELVLDPSTNTVLHYNFVAP